MRVGTRFYPADILFLSYHLAVVVVVGGRAWVIGSPLASFAFNLFAICSAYAVCKFASIPNRGAQTRKPHAALQFMRWFYPFFFFLPIYKQIGDINRLWIHFEWDSIFRNADQMLFGFQPASMWSKVWPQAWVSEIFHFAYFTYYFQFAGLALILYYRKKREREFHRFMAGIGMAFYVCNFAFLFFPALGPSFIGNHAQGLVQTHPPEMSGYIFTAIMKWIYQWEIPGGHFPSAHVALTTVTMFAAWHHKLERMVLWPLGVLLIVSTVYCGYHYALDVWGGLGVGLLAYAAACLWVGWLERDLNGLGS